MEGNPAVWVERGWKHFKCFRANSGCAEKSYRDLAALFQKSKLPRINALELTRKYQQPRKSVINGLLRRGDVANIIGGSKARKSFWVMQLVLSIAAGIKFLAWDTIQGRVLLIDNELRGDDLASRLIAMSRAMGLVWEDVAPNIDIMTLRGSLADLGAIRDELCSLPPESYSLVAVDALYKCLPRGCDENSNSDMTAAYVMLDEAAERHNCAAAIVHHTSKGAQHQKSVADMGSGAGAQSRSADAHIVLRAHEDPDTVVLMAILRSQKPIEPLCLVFDYPLWRLAPDKNPDAVAIINKKPVPTLDAFVGTIPIEPVPKTKALTHAKRILCTSKSSIDVLLDAAIEAGLVEIETPANRRLGHTIRRIQKEAA